MKKKKKGFLGKPTIAERVQTFRMEKQPHHGDFTLLFFVELLQQAGCVQTGDTPEAHTLPFPG